MALQVYDKINTIYKRYAFDGKKCPNEKWLRFRNKIILGDFSNKEAEYLFNCPWEAYSKIDGTNSKIAFYPSTEEIKVGGKTDRAESQHGQFEMLQEIAERIKPTLIELFPKESARFVPCKDESNKVKYWEVDPEDKFLGMNPIQPTHEGMYEVALEEVPIYIYGEYFGEGIMKCGRRYIEHGNKFVVFDINQQGWWVPKNVRDELCQKLGLETVPFLGTMTLKEIEDKVRNGFATQFPNASDSTLIEEGIVARPIIPLYDERKNRILVKVKYCDYIEYDSARKKFSNEEFEEFNKWYYDNIENIQP